MFDLGPNLSDLGGFILACLVEHVRKDERKLTIPERSHPNPRPTRSTMPMDIKTSWNTSQWSYSYEMSPIQACIYLEVQSNSPRFYFNPVALQLHRLFLLPSKGV